MVFKTDTAKSIYRFIIIFYLIYIYFFIGLLDCEINIDEVKIVLKDCLS